MRFTFSTLVAALVSSSATASAAPVETRQDALKPFEVTAMAYNAPSGLAGSSPCKTQPQYHGAQIFIDIFQGRPSERT